MKAIMLMFDSLNRHLLPSYGCDWTHAPNFRRLAERTVTFDKSYVCSMPCMPARRDLHTGRPNFLHRSWGPLEPFDRSFCDVLREHGVSSHLISDHYHYWEDGGATYHGRYDTWECFRGQESDGWKAVLDDDAVHIQPHINRKDRREFWVNRGFMPDDDSHNQTLTLNAASEFIDRNHAVDSWFLQIECFDPHEPFFTHQQWKDLYPRDYTGPLHDSPGYGEVTENEEQIREARLNYAALLSKCDASLGRVLDAMDEHDLWKDTMLVVWTDHGFMLGEHNFWAKNNPPLYEEISHTPFFIWDPRSAEKDSRRQALVQPAIDLAPTLLDYFGAPIPDTVLGKCMRPVIETDAAVRDFALFGYHGDSLNLTDGHHVCIRAPLPSNQPLFNYTLMPTVMRGFIRLELLAQAELVPPFSFTRNCPVLKIPLPGERHREDLLFDLENDPQQLSPLVDPALQKRMLQQMSRMLAECDAPQEQYERLALPPLSGA